MQPRICPNLRHRIKFCTHTWTQIYKISLQDYNAPPSKAHLDHYGHTYVTNLLIQSLVPSRIIMLWIANFIASKCTLPQSKSSSCSCMHTISCFIKVHTTKTDTTISLYSPLSSSIIGFYRIYNDKHIYALISITSRNN